MGHLMSECPNRGQAQRPESSRGPQFRGGRGRARGRGTPRAGARTFAMTIQEVQADPGTVTTYPYFSVDTVVLNNLCSTYLHVVVYLIHV